MDLSLWRTVLSVLSLSFHLWANRNDSPVYPVNQKGQGRRPFFLSVAAQGFDSSGMKHEETGITGVGDASVCCAEKL